MGVVGGPSLEYKTLGCLLADQSMADAVNHKLGSSFIIYHVYMFSPPKNKAEWDAAPRTVYETVDALLADGWVVD